MILDFTPTTFEMVRGDTFTLPLKLNQGNRLYYEQYQLQGNDKLYIGIMKPGESFENATIRCALDKNSARNENGDTIFKLNSVDTENLYPGKYYISIKLVRNGSVNTLVNDKLFFITGSDPVNKVGCC